jgi:hypothetical protein
MYTKDILVVLGFESEIAEWAGQQPGYRYDFGNLNLQVAQMMGKYFQPVMQFSGVIDTPRTLGVVKFSLLLEVESLEQGVALIAHNIGRDFTPLRHTPWLDQGRQWEDHLPGRRELRLYEQRPQCQVEPEWFRVAVKKLIAIGEAANEDAEFSVSFQDNVLRFDLSGEIMVMPATGESWPQIFWCRMQELRNLPKRTPLRGVCFSVWKEHLLIGRQQLPLRREIDAAQHFQTAME